MGLASVLLRKLAVIPNIASLGLGDNITVLDDNIGDGPLDSCVLLPVRALSLLTERIQDVNLRNAVLYALVCSIVTIWMVTTALARIALISTPFLRAYSMERKTVHGGKRENAGINSPSVDQYSECTIIGGSPIEKAALAKCALLGFKGDPRGGLVILFRKDIHTSGGVRKPRFRLLSQLGSDTDLLSRAVHDGHANLWAATFALTSGVCCRWQNRSRSMPRNFCCTSRIQSQVCLPHSLSSFRSQPTRALVQATTTTVSSTTLTTPIYVQVIWPECPAEEIIGAEFMT